MPKLDTNIYGSDDAGFANGVSSDALGSATPDKPGGKNDYSCGVDDSKLENTEVKTICIKGGSASSKGNH